MSCKFPLTAYRGRETNPETGKRPLSFNSSKGFYDTQLKIACGQCRACRRDYAKEWAIRCLHEASRFKNNCFITLTFNDKHINSTGTLVKEDFQLFMKRFRKAYTGYEPVTDRNGKTHYPIRYYHCGEYGSINGRPHHHACIFNFSFTDKILWKDDGRVKLYRSPSLERLWSHPITGDSYGYSTVGDVTYDSACYVAGYVSKKITGDKAPDHYQGRQPEYCTMSRRPGIGQSWFDKYSDDIKRNSGSLVMPGGFKHRLPKYYDKQFEITDLDAFKDIKAHRAEVVRNQTDNDQRRLYTKQLVEDGKYALKKRKL